MGVALTFSTHNFTFCRLIIPMEMDRPMLYFEKGLTEALHRVSLMLVLGKRRIRGYTSRDLHSGLFSDCVSNEVSFIRNPNSFFEGSG